VIRVETSNGFTSGLCVPAPARNRQQEKQFRTAQEAREINVIATTDGEINDMKTTDYPQDQREDSADQA
jgi:hypothetical protein